MEQPTVQTSKEINYFTVYTSSGWLYKVKVLVLFKFN